MFSEHCSSHAVMDFRLVLSNSVGVKSMTSAPIFILCMRGSGNVGFQILSFKSNRINSKLCQNGSEINIINRFFFLLNVVWGLKFWYSPSQFRHCFILYHLYYVCLFWLYHFQFNWTHWHTKMVKGSKFWCFKLINFVFESIRWS